MSGWSSENDGEFYKLAGYAYERFDPKGYTNLSLNAGDAIEPGRDIGRICLSGRSTGSARFRGKLKQASHHHRMLGRSSTTRIGRC